MNLHDVNQGIHKNKKRKRVGRGPGSGHGKTSGRGHKGQGAQRGWTSSPIFAGGQTSLLRRIPKRGFTNRWAQIVAIINVGDLEGCFAGGEAVSLESLRAKGLLKSRCDELKILGDGELTKKLKVTAHRFSRTAQEKIQAAGGEAIELPAKAKPVKGQKKSRPQSA